MKPFPHPAMTTLRAILNWCFLSYQHFSVAVFVAIVLIMILVEAL